MGTFDQCFLFLRHPRGGVEAIDRMKAAGFKAVFCNVGDFPPSDWEAIIRPRCQQHGVTCGPWLRTQDSDGGFDRNRLEFLIEVADTWQAPFIVNSEKELDHSGSSLTSLIRQLIEGREAALSMEAIPFASVDWTPLADIPVLPQVFGDSGFYDSIPIRNQWWAYGIRCVFPTFGTYGGCFPSDYPLLAPYSLYTADDMGGDYVYWSPRPGSYVGCQDTPPTPEDEMQLIGKEDGVKAACNRLRDLDPGGTLLAKVPDDKGKLVWQDISELEDVPLNQWKAYDKLQRTLQILVDDHDAAST